MIETLQNLPVGVVGFRAHGKVTADDYRNDLIPSIEGALVNAEHLHVLYEFADDFTGFELGAMWQDMMVDLEHINVWKRIAIISDKKWLRVIMRSFGVIMPCPLRAFAPDQKEDAMAWIQDPGLSGLHMELRETEGVLVLAPHGRLEAADFEQVKHLVDPYLEEHGKLHGLLIRADAFPGWHGLGAMFAHLGFVHDHQKHIARVAIVSDDDVLAHLPAMGKFFLSAELKHFPTAAQAEAWAWLKAAA